MEACDDTGLLESDRSGLGCSFEKFTEYKEIQSLIESLSHLDRNNTSYEKDYERFKYIVSLYKEQPHLIHPHLPTFIDGIISLVKNSDVKDDSLKHKAFKYMHLITNVAGYKVVVQYLPHGAQDLEPVLTLLESQNAKDTSTWETRYCLLLWLSIIAKIPFHLCRLESHDSSNASKITISERIIKLCQSYLLQRDSCRFAAAIVCANFFTRSDIKELYLKDFLDWICMTVKEKSIEYDNIGPLAALAAILKFGKREDMLPYSPALLQNMLTIEWKKDPFRLSRKYAIKVIQRIGLGFLKPRVVSWRYQRGFRSITETLSKMNSTEKTDNADKDNNKETPEEEDSSEIPQQIEDVIDELVQALTDPVLVVRWCGAKGIGRITGRLNKEMADEVVGCVIDLLSPLHGESAWHGGCLAIAELGKRGLLMPSRLEEVMKLLPLALQYDEPRGFSSVGVLVRDAACYVAWAFARAYDIQVLKPYLCSLACSLIIAMCFDREINIRRAASAAFQEHIGRQGAFPHGIDILTAADYFTVAVRSNAYLNISVFISQFNEYTKSMIDHLVNVKINHWDVAIRELSAQALHNLTKQDPEYMANDILPILLKAMDSIEVNRRHGAILSIGEIVHALSILNHPLSNNVEGELAELVSKMRDKHHFKGLTGEIMKTAGCHFILKCSLAHLPFQQLPVIDVWQTLLDECLVHEVDSVRLKAGEALSALSVQYYYPSSEKTQNLIKTYTSSLLSTEKFTRLGASLALGMLPPSLMESAVDKVITGLIECAQKTPATEKWVDNRRQAIKSLSSISNSLGFAAGTLSCRPYFDDIVKCLIDGLRDYTIDDRGDTGAWVREASISALQVVLLKAAEDDMSLFSEDLVSKSISGILQQAVERIDRTRFLAASVFTNLLHSNVPLIPLRKELCEIFPEKLLKSESWLTSYEMFPKFIQIMPFKVYSYNLLEGFITSIGGLTESLVKSASKTFFSWLDTQTIEEQERICSLIVEIFRANLKDDRLLQPIGSFLELLLVNGCLSGLLGLPTSTFAKDIFDLTKEAFSNSPMKFKCLASINIYCQLIQVGGTVSRQAASRLMLLLCHKFGWVRKACAQGLFEALIIAGEMLSDEPLDDALTILTDTDWALCPIAELRVQRNKLCTILKLPPPVLTSKSSTISN